MHREEGELRLSASDVSNYLACRHLTELDRAVAEGRRDAPEFRDPGLALLQKRGLAHELAYIAHLKSQGLKVVRPSEEGGKLSMERSLEAMHAGADAIVQVELRDGRWIGRADVLLRVSSPSGIGDWSYEVVDTKLAQETRAGTVLQLCHYSELLTALQGRTPEFMHVVTPGTDFGREGFRVDDYSSYYRLVRRHLEEATGRPPSEGACPAPMEHCEICRWRRKCDDSRHEVDSLTLVAGIRQLQVAELEDQGIKTLRQYSGEPAPVRRKPQRGCEESFVQVHGQARIQQEGRDSGQPRYRLLPPVEGRGLCRLPDPDPADVFLDFESDPFAGSGGMEYLIGLSLRAASGAMEYVRIWAMNPQEERLAFEHVMELVIARWRAHPGMHIYHYSAYEPGAMKRLAVRHACRELELDQLLRAERFIDLLAVTRQGLQASVERYSLKDLEAFTGYRRTVALDVAGAALRTVAWALELTEATDITPEVRAVVEGYNRDDCLSTMVLRNWLEERRAEHVNAGVSIPRPDNKNGEASEAIETRAEEIQQVYEALTARLPENRDDWGSIDRARWLLANMLEYFRREDKSAWWEFFRLHELGEDELLEERKAIGGLRFIGDVPASLRLPVHRYSFPEQEVGIVDGDELFEVGGDKVGKVHAIEPAARVLDIAKTGKASAVHPTSVMVNEHVSPKPVDVALLAFARSIAERGVDGEGPFRAARDLLLGVPPRLRLGTGGPLRNECEDIVAAAVRLAEALNEGVLPIQGPPGSGKTYAGARMIVALARQGRHIGVTSVSHKVIENLLKEAVRAAATGGVTLNPVHKQGRTSAGGSDGIEATSDNARAAAAVAEGRVVGATAWFWSRDEMVESLDYLFVDEAGQMSLAHALAAARSARNLVLLGDPRQLEQPQRGAHPEGADVAALVHVLQGSKTITPEKGLFLDTTWRLHPSVCAFTSEVYYENRLRSREGLDRQELRGPTQFVGSGLFYVPVLHTGSQNVSLEEVDTIDSIVQSLRASEVTWVDSKGAAHRLQASDVLVLAPYNAQVAALSRRLAGKARVGTVDMFQGQEAPVVIYSMTSSSSDDAPRGISFLYSPNRLNVATSRARCACILVASPRLLEPLCRSPEQMLWANGLCRYRELAREVVVASAVSRQPDMN